MRVDEYFLGAVIIFIAISIIVSYYRLRRRSDRQFGKGWRKKVREWENQPFD